MNRLRGIALAALSVAAFTETGRSWAQTYVDVTPGAAGVIASTNDGNVPANTVDGSLTTRWSANGDGQWLELDLGAVRTIGYVTAAIYSGNTRQSVFDIQVSSGGGTWTTVWSGSSSGTTTALETYNFTDVAGRWVRYLGHGNSVNAWNSVNELRAFAAAASYVEVTPGGAGVIASTNDGNVPVNAVDDSLATRWSANGDGQWLELDLGSVRTVGYVKAAIYSGNTRQSVFDIQVSGGGGLWTTVWSGSSSGTTTALETFDFPDAGGRWVRYLGHGNSVNAWNSVNEIQVFALSGGSTPTPTPTSTPVSVTPTPTPTPTPTLTPTPSLTCKSTLDNGGPASTWAFWNASGQQLSYKTLATLYRYDGTTYAGGSDQIMDFSHAGYRGGGVALPAVSTKVTLSPAASGDDTPRIQAALDQVAAMPLDSGGIRGAVVLTAGTYRLDGTLTFAVSGVVLRGAGSGTTGTLLDLGAASHTAFAINGAGTRTLGAATAITNTYLAVGSRNLTVASTAGLSVGTPVAVIRTSTAGWIEHMSMHDLLRNGAPQTWLSATSQMVTERRITAISGTQLTLDAPVSDSIDTRYVSGQVAPYTYSARISQVGIEGLRVLGRATPQGYKMLSMDAVTDSWVKNLYGRDLRSGLSVNDSASRITVDSVTLDHTYADTAGAAPSDYNLSGTQTLVVRCKSLNATGWFHAITGGSDTGPVVILDFQGTGGSPIQPHQRWATGLLTDRANITGGAVEYIDRGNLGSGHGWTMGWGVSWNSQAKINLQRPPGSMNWAIGNVGTIGTSTEYGSGDTLPLGIYESHGTNVSPSSLYLAQLCSRLGPSALTNIGY